MEMLRTTSGLLSASQAHGSQERTWGKDHFHPSIPSDWGFRGSSAGKESACNTRDPISIPGLGRSPGEGNGNPLQYSCLENSMDRKASWATVCGIAKLLSDQIRSVAQSCPTLCDPMNRSTPGLPVHHQLPEFTQTHVHRVSDAIQPSHPLSSPSPPAPNPSQHQGLFQ